MCGARAPASTGLDRFMGGRSLRHGYPRPTCLLVHRGTAATWGAPGSPLVLCNEEGEVLKRKALRSCVRRAARRGHVENDGVHVLRHTLCSHLAMRGAPARAIQELAGHANLSTTQRYMHLSPAALEGAIRLLDQPSPDLRRGDIVDTANR